MTRSCRMSAAMVPALAALLLSTLAVSSAQTFPCPSSSSNSATAGGYQNLNLNTASNADVVNIVTGTNASFVDWVETGGNITACNNTDLIGEVAFDVVRVCSQVVAGTNYGIRYLVNYNCVVDANTVAEDQLVINTVVFFPLPSNGATSAPQVQSVWQDQDYPIEQVEIVAVPSAAPTPGPPTGSTTTAQAPTTNLRSFGNLDGL